MVSSTTDTGIVASLFEQRNSIFRGLFRGRPLSKGLAEEKHVAELRDGVSDPLHKFNMSYVEDQYQTIRTWLEIVKEKLGFPTGCVHDE